MVISSLRHELKARNISSKGLKSQLVARLTKTLKTESEKDSNATKEKEQESSSGEPESEVEEKKPEVVLTYVIAKN